MEDDSQDKRLRPRSPTVSYRTDEDSEIDVIVESSLESYNTPMHKNDLFGGREEGKKYNVSSNNPPKKKPSLKKV